MRFKKERSKVYRKGQFTIFVILGIVIMFAFAFAIYSRGKIVNTQLAAQADIQIKEYIDDNSINQYVTSCLDAVSEDVVIRYSSQGGTINFSNKILNKDYVQYYDRDYNKTFNVSVVIDENAACPDTSVLPSQFIVTQSPGYYPYTCGYMSLDNLKPLYDSYGQGPCHNSCVGSDFFVHSGFFGVNNLPVLCDPNGGNRPGIVGHGLHYTTCDYYAYYSTSLQQAIESQIASEISKCVNFTDILKRSPSNITLVGNVTSQITFGVQSFDVKLEYPFTVMMYNRQPVTRMVDFQTQKNIPLKELYDYTYELANTEVKDVKFNIGTDYKSVIPEVWSTSQSGNLYTPAYSVNIFSGNMSNNYTDIIQVADTDTVSNIRGNNLKINFAIKNRAPALEYIHDSSSQDYDIAGVENETLVLNPQGYDPDEEHELSYTYSLWKEDYTEYYNYADPLCNPDPLRNHPTSLAYVIANCSKINTSSSSLYPRNWTGSSFFKSTAQKADYRPTHTDAGFHTVNIKVTDRQGLFDYQPVRILIFDMPKAVVNGSNDYSDVQKNRASYEDRYTLDGSNSVVGTIAQSLGATFQTFAWNDTIEPFYTSVYIHSPGDKTLAIPDAIPDATSHVVPKNLDIQNIINYIFVRGANWKTSSIYTSIYTPISTIHRISLTVNISSGIKNTAYFDVNVTRCLNHSNPSNPSYPYNHNPSDLNDELTADHTCCTNNYDYAPTSKECYNYTRYGSWNSFKDFSKTPNPPINLIPVYKNNDASRSAISNPPVKPYDNDIYNQSFERFCSGDRGNTCTGSAVEIIQVVESCDDSNRVKNINFQKERCSGPDVSYNIPNSATSIEPHCKYYLPYQTFESKFDSGSGTCTVSKQPSSGSGSGKFSDSNPKNFICDGSCNGDGTCGYAFNCECKAGNGGNGDSACDGLTSQKNMGTCGKKGTQSWFEDMCTSTCALTKVSSEICRSNKFDPSCTADDACNGLSPNSIVKNCVANTPFQAECSSNCMITDFAELSGSRILHTHGTAGSDWDNCPSTVDARCDLKLPGYIVDTSHYCDNVGVVQNCNVGYVSTGDILHPCVLETVNSK